jgi:hypothetical protein
MHLNLLDSYAPFFTCTRISCKRRVFYIIIISTYDGENLLILETVKNDKDDIELVACLYCDKEFK